MSEEQCYEFLAAFEQWEKDCNESRTIKDPPIKAIGWTKRAQLMNTLIRYNNIKEKMKQNFYSDSKVKETISSFFLPENPDSDKNASFFTMLPGSLLLKYTIKLSSPFISRDDLPFYPTDNSLKRHWVFDTPYLATSGLKGILRWAHRARLNSAKDDNIAEALFGNAPEDSSNDLSVQGLVRPYPIYWDGTFGVDITNKQNPEKLSGSVPVKYEILKNAVGDIYIFLPVPLYNANPNFYKDCVSALLDDIEWLLSDGALSAKKTAGWGKINLANLQAKAWIRVDKSPEEKKSNEAQKNETPTSNKTDVERWNKLFKIKHGEKILLSKEEIDAKIKQDNSFAPWKLLPNVSQKKWEKEPDKYYAELKKLAEVNAEKQKKESEQLEPQPQPEQNCTQPEKKIVRGAASVFLSNSQGKIAWDAFKKQILEKIVEAQNG